MPEFTVRVYAVMPVTEDYIEAETAKQAATKLRSIAELPSLDGGWPDYITVTDSAGNVVHEEDWQ